MGRSVAAAARRMGPPSLCPRSQPWPPLQPNARTRARSPGASIHQGSSPSCTHREVHAKSLARQHAQRSGHSGHSGDQDVVSLRVLLHRCNNAGQEVGAAQAWGPALGRGAPAPAAAPKAPGAQGGPCAGWHHHGDSCRQCTCKLTHQRPPIGGQAICHQAQESAKNGAEHPLSTHLRSLQQALQGAAGGAGVFSACDRSQQQQGPGLLRWGASRAPAGQEPLRQLRASPPACLAQQRHGDHGKREAGPLEQEHSGLPPRHANPCEAEGREAEHLQAGRAAGNASSRRQHGACGQHTLQLTDGQMRAGSWWHGRRGSTTRRETAHAPPSPGGWPAGSGRALSAWISTSSRVWRRGGTTSSLLAGETGGVGCGAAAAAGISGGGGGMSCWRGAASERTLIACSGVAFWGHRRGRGGLRGSALARTLACKCRRRALTGLTRWAESAEQRSARISSWMPGAPAAAEAGRCAHRKWLLGELLRG